MSNSKILVLVSALGLGLAGCASVTTMFKADSEKYAIPTVGSYIQVNQVLEAKSGARVRIQNGEVLHWRDVFRLEPYCEFYVFRTPGELKKALVIEKDKFIIEGVFRRKDLTAAENILYASNLMETDHGSSERSMSTYIKLSSPQQPNVTHLICKRWADPYYQNHVGLQDIRGTLGSLVELVPAN